MSERQIRKSIRTLLEMLGDRDESFKVTNEEVLADLVKENSSFAFIDVAGYRIVYMLADRYRTADLSRVDKMRSEDDAHTWIFVSKSPKSLTQHNQTALSAKLGSVEFFNLDELQFNISRHDLVPKHTVVRDPKEIRAILDSYSIRHRHQLPLLLRTDPMSRYLGLRKDDVVKISRNSVAAGEYTSYRAVA
jgi:DNA-directed RNA polymerase subunit H (RpoH/RPB5)/mRNA-degrading endonuclease RelE of RelBE toxin-antitoxin system